MKQSPPQKKPEIKLEAARAIGCAFKEARESKAISLGDAAEKLLMSSHQVNGLESGELKNFYGAKLYAQAADKYAAYLNITERPSDALFIDEGAEHADSENAPESPVQKGCTEETKPTPSTKVRDYRLLVAGALIVLLTTLAYTQLGDNKVPEATPLPVIKQAPIPAESKPENPSTAAQETAPVSTSNSIKAGFIQLNLTGNSWIQVVYANGDKQDKTYRTGDTLDLEASKLQALIIGNATAVTLENSKKAIDLSAYTSPGSKVARIIGPQIRQLGKQNANY